jgi:hypothetical protein
LGKEIDEEVMNNIHLKSERLYLSPVNIFYLEAIHQLHSLPETDLINALGIPENMEQTQSIIEQWISGNKKRR